MIRLQRVTPGLLTRFATSGRFVPEDGQGYLGGWFVIPPRGYVRWVAADAFGMPNMRALEGALERVLQGQLEYQDETDARGLAKLLGVSHRRALALLKGGRIEGAYQLKGGAWRVPLPLRIRPASRGSRAGWEDRGIAP